MIGSSSQQRNQKSVARDRTESSEVSELEGICTVGKEENKCLLISEPPNPEARKPFKQRHVTGEKVFVRSIAVITR
jgi:hypothetical protein